MDAAASAADLHAALRAAGLGPPYVLVGHSYGGLVVRMFADRYALEVAGMVLVDASHPHRSPRPWSGRHPPGQACGCYQCSSR